jgi:ribosomal protein S18 acetylase RimI-like enzyme
MSFVLRSALPEDAESIARINADSWRDSYRGIVPDSVLERPLETDFLRQWRALAAAPPGGQMILVAGDATAALHGFVSAGPGRRQPLGFDAEVYALYVDKEARRMRLGSRLLGAAAQRLALFGRMNVMLWVLEANHTARAFYVGLGGAEIGLRKERVFGAALPTVAYGWSRIASLVDACSDRMAVP